MGKVYIFTNDYMPGVVKIGLTNNSIEERLRGLDTTGVPAPFRAHYAIECGEHYSNIEKQLHSAYTENRIRNNREFFEVEPENVVRTMKFYIEMGLTEEIDVSDEMVDESGNKTVKAKTPKRSGKFSFSEVGIEIGSELFFSRDENIKCIVFSDNTVEYKEKEYSLSSLAVKLLQDMGYKSTNVSGPRYFLYNNTVLSDMWLKF